MAPRPVLARGWTFKVNGTAIGGLKTFSVEPATEEVDDTDFDNNGNGAHSVTGRAVSIKLSGNHKEDIDTGDRDPGQAAIETLGDLFGVDAEFDFVMTSPGGNIRSCRATVGMDSHGGGTKDNTSWGCTVKRTGGWL